MISDSTHHLFTGAEHQLLVELEEVEPVLRLAGLGVDGVQELSDNLDDFRQGILVRIVVRGMLEYGSK